MRIYKYHFYNYLVRATNVNERAYFFLNDVNKILGYHNNDVFNNIKNNKIFNDYTHHIRSYYINELSNSIINNHYNIFVDYFCIQKIANNSNSSKALKFEQWLDLHICPELYKKVNHKKEDIVYTMDEVWNMVMKSNGVKKQKEMLLKYGDRIKIIGPDGRFI